MMSN